MPLHTQTMYGRPSAKTIAGPVRATADGTFAVLDVRQRVSDIPGEYIPTRIVITSSSLLFVVILEKICFPLAFVGY